MATIPIRLVDANPFQSRTRENAAEIDLLAEELKEGEFWDTKFRLRQVDGRYQLAWGHQRVAALKKLGYKEINAEIVKLSDIAMAEESLCENLQRTGLDEMSKAEAIARLYKMLLEGEWKDNRKGAILHLCKLLGYKTTTTIEQFLEMAGMSAPTRELLREYNVGRRLAGTAHEVGGEKMVRHAVQKNISRPDLERMKAVMDDLPETTRKKIADKILDQKIVKPETVKALVRREQEKLAPRKLPTDVRVFIVYWTAQLRSLNKKFRSACKPTIQEYIHQDSSVIAELRNAADEFIDTMKELLDLRSPYGKS
jgi:hypothetical protein